MIFVDLLYSVSLLFSLISAGLAVGLIRFRNDRWKSFTLWLIRVSAVLLLLSVMVHRMYGHGPSSIEPMDWSTYVSAHPAFLVGAILVLVGFFTHRILYPKRPENPKK